MTSVKEISKIMDIELQKLSSLFDIADSKINMNIHEIVEIYYQVMNVSSIDIMFKRQVMSEPKELIDKIQQTEKLISERFNFGIHPKIMKYLSASIQELTKRLQSKKSDEKLKEQTESDVKLYNKLRQTMSTKEFVEQYENRISYD